MEFSKIIVEKLLEIIIEKPITSIIGAIIILIIIIITDYSLTKNSKDETKETKKNNQTIILERNNVNIEIHNHYYNDRKKPDHLEEEINTTKYNDIDSIENSPKNNKAIANEE